MESELVKAAQAVLAKYNDVLREANKIPFDDTANIFENLRTALAAHEKAREGMQIAGLGQIILDEIRQDGTIATMPERIEGLIAARLAGAGVKVVTPPDREAVEKVLRANMIGECCEDSSHDVYHFPTTVRETADAILALFGATIKEANRG